MYTEKIQKFIARSGYCSRRKAEKLIEEKKVTVNKNLAKLGMRVSEKDVIRIEGKTLKPKEKTIIIALNKPKGYSCTHKEVPGEKNIFTLLDLKERVFIAGRLDKNSRGLVILTNNGELAYKLTHPSFEHEKEYKVELSKDLKEEVAEKLKEGVDIGEKTKAKIKEIEKIKNKKYRVILSEGKNRQIRRMFEVFNYTVTDLQRVRIDKYKLKKIKEGNWYFIEPKK